VNPFHVCVYIIAFVFYSQRSPGVRRHDIAEILMKVALKHQKSNQNEMYMEFVLESFVIVCHELLGNPTTELIELPGP
jgi:hypothetical protein